MKLKIIYTFLLSTLLIACSQPKKAGSEEEAHPTVEKSADIGIPKAKLGDTSLYKVEVKFVVDNANPDGIKAIVQLRSKTEEVLSDDWELRYFQIGTTTYQNFEKRGYYGRNEPHYLNVIRFLPNSISSPFTTRIGFVNRDGYFISYDIENKTLPR